MNSSKQAGFTLPELLSVMAVTLLFSGLIVLFTFQYWRASATLGNDLASFGSRLTAGDRLRDAFNASSGLIIQNGIADNNVGDPDPLIGSGLHWKPLHAVPGTTAIGASGTATPILYFKSPSVDTSKNVIMNGTQPYEDEYILYMDGTSKELRMRTLINANTTTNRNKTTCPAASVTAACPIDRLIGDNISAVGLRYFSKSGNLMDYRSIVDPITGEYIGPDFPAVEVIELTLQVFKKSTVQGGSDTTSQTIVRIALRNS